MKHNHDGFSIIELIIILLLIGAVGGVAYGVGSHKNKIVNKANITTTLAKTGKTDYTGNNSDRTKASLKTAVSKYELLNYSYPADWIVTDNSVASQNNDGVNPGSDRIVITATSGLIINIRAGLGGIGFEGDLVNVQPLKFLNKDMQLAYGKSLGDTDMSGADATSLFVTDGVTPFLPGKNVNYGKGHAAMSFSISYDEKTGKKGQQTIKSDPAFPAAIAVLESIKY